MSNYLRKSNDAVSGTAPRTRGRKVWLASGLAGLTGVVSLAGIGVATNANAVGIDRLADLKWSAAEQFVKRDGGHGPDGRGAPGGREEGKGPNGEGRDGEGRDGKGQEGKGQDGKGEEGKGEEGKGEEGKGEDGKGEDGYGRVQDVLCDPDRLIAAITRANADNGGTLRLAKNCTYSLTTNNGPGGSGLPPITQNITIKGEGATLVRAANATQFRFFDVTSGGHLRLADLTLTGGNGLTGGAVIVRTGATATIEKTKLVNNDALAAGGAIENNGTTTLDHTTLTNNSAVLAGGAINNTGLLRINESELKANNAGGAGGALNNLAGTVVLHKSAVVGNRSIGAGGGISSAGGILDIANAEVNENTTGLTGGGIAVLNTQLTIRHSTISRNASIGGGGGISNTAGLLLTSSTTIENSKITDNVTNGIGGGGILNTDLTPNIGGTATLTIRNTDISKNKATLGGGIRNLGGTVTLTNTKIVTNTATITNGGGGINTNTAITTIDPTTVIVANRPNNCTGTVTNCFG
ncbi:right-handed parallel beta-helix repeat-containing protein [Micromonospora sp. DT233]|uniref:right-handed parallel beta-helix repeat-containing protein n=1 Tax=Micromonospora sp. DT233 TaxID=3393432 RepID=UPI003CECB5FF